MPRYLGRCFTVVTAFITVLAATACSTPQGVAPQVVGPLAHPLPDPIASGLGLTLQEFATIPPSQPDPLPPPGDNLDRWDRINYLGEIPDGSGRLFVPDLNGKLYTLKNGVPRTYLDVGAAVGPSFWDHSALGTGFGFVAFHPDFQRNGKFYTVHTE